ncbi:MAG: tetratricopeptide repeat protein [Planctomycetes bacterium]|nr:tetratricopeptide repeat protein [Planctomycetota bacterium]
MARDLAGDQDSPDVALVADNLAKCLFDLAHYEDSLRLREELSEMLARTAGFGDPGAVTREMREIASCLGALGRPSEALSRCEQALALHEESAAAGDEGARAALLGVMAQCLDVLERRDEALERRAQALACARSVCQGRDDPRLVDALLGSGWSFAAGGRHTEALRFYEEGAAMALRVAGGRDGTQVAQARMGLGGCLVQLGRPGEGMPHLREALAMWRRLFDGRDHPDLARALSQFATAVNVAGDCDEARARYEEALAMRRRVLAGREDVDLAANLTNLGLCLMALGRVDDALPMFEEAIAMHRRMGGATVRGICSNLNNLALCLRDLGRIPEALACVEQALALARTAVGEYPGDVVPLRHNLAMLQGDSGHDREALASTEAVLATLRQRHGDADHPDLIPARMNLAVRLVNVGRGDDALEQSESALAMARRLYGDRAHPLVPEVLLVLGDCLRYLGRGTDAIPHYEAALAMQRQLFGPDHPLVPDLLSSLAGALHDVGRLDDARRRCEDACATIERVRERTRASSELRQAAFDRFKRAEVFERLQVLCVGAKDPAAAWEAAERSRARNLLDCMSQQHFDAIDVALTRAKVRGDVESAARLPRLRDEVRAVELESDRALHELAVLDDGPLGDGERGERREQWMARFRDASQRRRELLDECARRTGDVSPAGRTRSAAEVRAVLGEGEMLLQYTVTPAASFLYVLTAEGGVEAFDLPRAHAASTAEAATRRDGVVDSATEAARGRDPAGLPVDGREMQSPDLFAALIPEALWPRLQKARRVFVAAHRGLHAVAFEALVTSQREGRPVRWLDEGPPVAYVPSGSMLFWLRQRSREAHDDVTSLDLLAVGDPAAEAAAEVPQEGAFVLGVKEGGEAARAGLRPGDVIVAYDGRPVAHDKALRDAIGVVVAAIEDGKRTNEPVAVRIWRRGASVDLTAAPERLDVEVGMGAARAVSDAQVAGNDGFRRVVRAGEIERIGRLPPLVGARAETEAIERVFADRHASVRRLLGVEATEPAVFELAAKAKYLHLACHGIAEEYAGQSLGMLVLSQPRRVLPGDDGLLKLSDLFGAWRGRLASCRLVVLSACRTNVGPTLRDETPQALSIGFLFAGATAVVSSLWAVDDASTKELMTDFYGRILAGESDRLKALTEAKKALRAKYPDPFHWAPFLYMGAPE